ncbi:metalloregulator ArsR/SmtB family transcription factor [Chloroflexi bacterium TSY]|nr:metalloregulator ArsR/SmtB family transcription factor [Chloroflexi bacterium TSY]
MSIIVSSQAGSDSYHAIADPNRRLILDILRQESPVRASDIVNQLQHISQPAVSKHLRILREATLVQSKSVGRERYYSLNPLALQKIMLWLRQYEVLWDKRLSTLKALAEKEQKASQLEVQATHLTLNDNPSLDGPVAVTQQICR